MVEENIVNKFAAVDRCIGIANNLVVDKNVVNKLAGIYANENKFAEDEVVWVAVVLILLKLYSYYY